ncbi:MAG TPA: hypothetical protein VLS95_16010 [Arthrobacter sp.]|nr:hypothetical protein [Arthrobacter sp.]
MDQSLNAHVKVDTVTDTVRIDVLGSLTQATRPTLMQTIQRIRQMGITSHVRVEIGGASFVESAALAGLRNDLNAIDGGDIPGDVAGALRTGGVSLELSTHRFDPAAALQPLDLAGEFKASIDASGTRPLTGYSDDELLAASDSVFGLLDNPADMARSELLATYDDIGLEISRRAVGRTPEPA